MAKRKYYKAHVIDMFFIQGNRITLEVVIESCYGNLYRAHLEDNLEEIIEIKNNDFSNLFLRGHYYGFGVNWKSINSQAIDWSECRLSEKLQRRITV